MANTFFRFKAFTIQQDRCAMKVTTDGCIFGAWCAADILLQNNLARVLDVGAGIGLLSLMLAQKLKAHITAIELDADAAAQAKENIGASPWKERLTVINSDVLKHNFEEKFETIVCNPPFYENDLTSPNSKKNLAHHHLSLRLTDLLPGMKRWLSTGGALYLLVPFKRDEELASILNKEGYFIAKKIALAPTASHPPIRMMLKAVLSPVDKKGGIIFIKNADQQYSSETMQLLKDYYLHL
ncbi:MAG TPA: methyltransferase [Chitinophagaceae bacterium]|nr:methyltransferase [Chitinophagaceae bacterium]